MQQSEMTQVARAAVLPGPESHLGLRSWARELVSLATVTVRPPPYATQDLPKGDGRTVLLVPGFLAGDWTMLRLRQFLENLDYRVEHAGIVFNPGPTAGTIARLESALLRLSREAGPIDLVGQSLGGVFAREMARRHTRHVRSVVTLCTPIHFPVTTPLAPFAQMFAPFHDASWSVRSVELAQPLPVPVTAIYSRDDGIVDWRQCLQDEAPGCRNVRVSGAHSTVGSNPEAQIAVAMALGNAVGAGPVA
jgi:pimeloyl-ACP methyl ester carboxylesterase